MNAPFKLTPQATEDLDAIWWFIADSNRDSADRVEAEIVAAFRRLAKHPLMGTKRQDIAPLPVRFWTVPKFPNYVIVYRPATIPLEVVAVLHGRRNLKEVLGKQSLLRLPNCALVRNISHRTRSARARIALPDSRKCVGLRSAIRSWSPDLA